MKELSTKDGVRFIKDVRVPMADGVELSLDMHVPDEGWGSTPRPLLLEYIPYRKDDSAPHTGYHQRFAENGIIGARLDCRGSGASGGTTHDEYTVQEQEDGAAAIFENLLQITDLICDEIGLPRDGNDIRFEYEPATRDYDEKVVVRKGTMAGLVIQAMSTFEGEPTATVEVRFLLGTDYVSEEFLAAAPRTGWIQVEVNGVPNNIFNHEIIYEPKIVKTRSTGTGLV